MSQQDKIDDLEKELSWLREHVRAYGDPHDLRAAIADTLKLLDDGRGLRAREKLEEALARSDEHHDAPGAPPMVAVPRSPAATPLDVARAALSYATDELETLRATTASTFVGDELQAIIDKLDVAVLATAPPPPACAMCNRAHVRGEWWPRHPFKPQLRVSS